MCAALEGGRLASIVARLTPQSKENQYADLKARADHFCISCLAAIAHEGHQMECKKTNMQAIKADIQAMNDGEAKTVAMKEMKMAEDDGQEGHECV